MAVFLLASGPSAKAVLAGPPVPAIRHVESGMASWYGEDFAGRRTASGDVFDPEKMTAAHPALPFDTIITVTNLANGRHIRLRVNDRGPYAGERIVDVSAAAARHLGFKKRGVAHVRIDAQARSLRFSRMGNR